MSVSVEHQMTEIYCFVDEFLQPHPALAHWRRSSHAQPQFSDAEVLTIAFLQGGLAVATLKQTYRFCAPIRHGRGRLLREEGAYFGKTSKGGFFGFKLHRLRHISGRVLNILLTPGNLDDRDPAVALRQTVDGGVTLGDLGYHGLECANSLAEEAAMLLITRDQAPEHKFLLSQVRQGIETTFSQLWWQFVDRVFSRAWRGLWNMIQLKVLFYNLVHAGIVTV